MTMNRAVLILMCALVASPAYSQGTERMTGSVKTLPPAVPAPRTGPLIPKTDSFADPVIVSRDRSGQCTLPPCVSTMLGGSTLTPALYYKKARWMQSQEGLKLCAAVNRACPITFHAQDAEYPDLAQLFQDDSFKNITALPRCLVIRWPNSVSSTPFAVMQTRGDRFPCSQP